MSALLGAALLAAVAWAAAPTTPRAKKVPRPSARGSVAFANGGLSAVPGKTPPPAQGYGGVRKGAGAEEEVWPAWPDCVLTDKAFRSPIPVYADVRRFINHPDEVRHRTITFNSFEKVGMALEEEPHELGEVVLDVLPDSQALRAGVRKGWIIKEIDGRPFKPTERLKDVAEDFDRARKAGATLTVKYDVRTYFDCFNATCAKSDRFPTESREACAEACASVGGCAWWSFGKEDQDSMCLLQGQAKGFVASAGTSTGARKCLPAPHWLGLPASWPGCVVSDANLKGGARVFADVRPFLGPEELRHRTVLFDVNTDIGLVMREGAHEKGEVVSGVVEGTQAAKAGVRTGWIITSVDGKSFKKTRGIEDVMSDFNKLRGSTGTLEVDFDVRTSADCEAGDCARSDRAPAASAAACAGMCGQVPDCQWWVFASEQEDSTCWFRGAGTTVEARAGSSAGSRACAPPRGGGLVLLASSVLLVACCYYFRAAILVRLVATVGLLRGTPANGMSWKRSGPTLELGKAGDFALGDDDADEQHTLISRHRKAHAVDDDDFDNAL
mmetsp:Transcript_101231/g.287021  ORF Transcript_101231/g.287021 Transcript_101231/m.287021 type:complete len:555 (+) Transcript_101231:78-1742(+)